MESEVRVISKTGRKLISLEQAKNVAKEQSEEAFPETSSIRANWGKKNEHLGGLVETTTDLLLQEVPQKY